jgi:hypothetical protein
MEEVLWRNLVIGKSYYAATTGYLGDHIRHEITVTDIHVMNPEESMIYIHCATDPVIKGFAVGGIFEGVIGPKNRFWVTNSEGLTSQSSISAAAG